MWWDWLDRRKRESRDRTEQLRAERGKLAEAVVELDRRKHNVEELMKRMIEETHNA